MPRHAFEYDVRNRVNGISYFIESTSDWLFLDVLGDPKK